MVRGGLYPTTSLFSRVSLALVMLGVLLALTLLVN